MSAGVDVGRRRRSRVEAERLVLEFERSGLSRRAFCAQYGLSVPSLDQYRKRFRDGMSSSAMTEAAANRILPVEFVDGAALPVESLRPLRVELTSGRRIEVAPGFDASTLERLVAVLEKA
jgi:transposase